MAEVMSTINRNIAYQLTHGAPPVPATLLLQNVAYDPNTHIAKINFIPGSGHTRPDYTISLVDDGAGGLDDFFDLMNVPMDKRASYIGSHVNISWEFPDVWDREEQHLFFHASFVNHTQFNYLGQQGDFYPKPSKIYTADNLPMECYFWVSFDCMTPVELKFEEFIIELAFIIDSTDYQSP
jgi:hypothetical protein